MYDPALGRFLSPDPFMQDPSNTQNFNRYSYCLNNPLKFTDPSGFQYSGSTFHQPSTSCGSGNLFSFSPHESSFHSSWDNDWDDLMASGIDLGWISSFGSIEPGAKISGHETGYVSKYIDLGKLGKFYYAQNSITGSIRTGFKYSYIEKGFMDFTFIGDNGEKNWRKKEIDVVVIGYGYYEFNPRGLHRERNPSSIGFPLTGDKFYSKDGVLLWDTKMEGDPNRVLVFESLGKNQTFADIVKGTDPSRLLMRMRQASVEYNFGKPNLNSNYLFVTEKTSIWTDLKAAFHFAGEGFVSGYIGAKSRSKNAGLESHYNMTFTARDYWLDTYSVKTFQPWW